MDHRELDRRMKELAPYLDMFGDRLREIIEGDEKLLSLKNFIDRKGTDLWLEMALHIRPRKQAGMRVTEEDKAFLKSFKIQY